MIDEVLTGDRMVPGWPPWRDGGPPPDQLYRVGTAAAVIRMLKIPDGSMQLFLQGVQRVRVVEYTQREPTARARVEAVRETMHKGVELGA